MSNLLSRWVKSRVNTGYKISIDSNNSLDCVDVPKDWAEFIYGKPFIEVYCFGNAKDHWARANPNYWSRSQTPKLGSIMCMGAGIGGGYGHVGVVIAIDGNNVTLAQQDTFKQVPVYTGVWSSKASYVQGFLIPSVEVGESKVVEDYQRSVVSAGAKYRKSPNLNAEVIEIFKSGETINFKGWVRGDSVDNNNVWFVGRFTGGYSWSGGYTDSSVAGLEDLNSKAIGANQREVSSDVMNVRSQSRVEAGNVVRQTNPGAVETLAGFVKGQNIDGVDVWFVTTAGHYIWSKGFTNSTTSGLANLTPPPIIPPEVPITPTPVEPPYSFAKSLECVTEVIPAAIGNFEVGNFPANPIKVVLHDYGTEGIDTFGSTINEFKRPGAEKSANFVVSGKNIVQMVKLGDRAYHAGPGGNDFVGMELDPAQDADTIDSGRRLLTELRDFYGYELEKVKHSSIKATLCGDDITLSDYDLEPIGVETPIEPETPAETSEAVKSATKFVARIATQWGASKLIVTGILGLLTPYGITLSNKAEGIAVLVITALIIAWAQFGFKIKSNNKWPF